MELPEIEFEFYTLPNGLEVILHVDDSTPIVGVNTWYHVGSKNERPGRSGFAHLFEHMMFQGSANLPKGAFDQLISGNGGDGLGGALGVGVSGATVDITDSVLRLNGGWGGSVTGISSIDGYDASENSSGTYFDYKDKRWYKFRVRVTDRMIQCWADDEQVVDVDCKGVSLCRGGRNANLLAEG